MFRSGSENGIQWSSAAELRRNTPEEWAELEQEFDDLEAGRKPTVSWDDLVSRIRTSIGWTDSNSDPEPRET